MRTAIVLGAGMAGVSAALQLQERGWSVALVDRTAPGRETSYGNAGIIQSEAVEPYPMPRSLGALLAIALRRGNDIHYRASALPRQAGSLLRYWWHSAPVRHERIATAYAAIIAHATGEHGRLVALAGAEALVRRDGFRILHRDPAAMEAAAADAERLRARHGVPFRRMSADELRRAEPGLSESGVGAIHWTDPWTVRDPGGLVEAYVALFAGLGGSIQRGDAGALARAPSGGWRVVTESGPVEAEHAVVALGPWAPGLLRRFGYRLPLVLKRGYHRHYDPVAPLDLPLMDAAFGYLLVPMKQGIRLTTGAELAAPGDAANPVQLRNAEREARSLLRLGAPVEAEPWFGTRPCMPDMLPVVGEVPGQPGLWLHAGHGHQGFTLGPATGRLLAEVMAGERPFVDPTPFRADRQRF